MSKKNKEKLIKGSKYGLMKRVFKQMGADPARRLSLHDVMVDLGYIISRQSVQQFSEALSAKGKEQARKIKDLPVTWKIIDILSKKIKKLEKENDELRATMSQNQG